MNSMKKLVVSVFAAVAASSAAHADPLKATVIHWWTSGGESAAIKQFADAYRDDSPQDSRDFAVHDCCPPPC